MRPLQIVRDVSVILACVCVVVMTFIALHFLASVGHALDGFTSQYSPTPTVSCSDPSATWDQC